MRKRIINLVSLLFADASAVTAALLISHAERTWLERFDAFSGYEGDWQRYAFSGFLYGFFAAVFYAFGLYTRRNDFWEETRKIFQGVFFLLILIALYLFVTKTAEHYSRTMIVLVVVNSAWLLPLFRVLAKRLLYRLHIWQLPALVVGNSLQTEKLINDLNANWYLGFKPTKAPRKESVVFIATKHMPVETLESLIDYYKKRFADVIIIPYLHNLSFANTEIIDLRIGQISMINIQNQLFRPGNLLLKGITEWSIVVVLLPPFLLIYALIALWIRLDSKGPVLFVQRRLGKNGRPFSCYKFRTMHSDGERMLQAYLAEHPEEAAHYAHYHKYRNDPRVTRAGRWLRRFSLDELPQMLNVLKGDMSLIGPRPYMLDERAKLGEKAETILHVRPGITGFWQVKGRNDLSFEARTDLDVWYIRNWSLWLDFIIFVKTFEVLVTRRGAK